MYKTIRQIAEWGVQPDTPFEQAHHIRLTNVMLLLLFIGSIIQTGICFFTGAYQAALLNSTAPFVFGGGLWLMRKGHTKLARFLVVTICYVASYAFMTILGPQSYFQFIFLFGSAFALVFFSIQERWLLFYGIFMPVIFFVLLEVNHYEPILGLKRAEFRPEQIFLLRTVSMALVWSLMTFHFFYFIRDRRKFQEKLVSSAKMVAMANMAAGIAHEINNPLQVIVSYSDRLKRLAKSPDISEGQLSEIAEKIQSVALRIGSINRGLLALTRDTQGDPFEPVSVHSLIRTSVDFCRAHLEFHNVELKICEVPEKLTVIGRETQLCEVILNVLNNGLSAIKTSSEKWIGFDVIAEPEWVEIAISDSGPGIDSKVIEKIFDPFFTTKPMGEGTGLGLSISRGIMMDHNGKIYYEPKGDGARFVLRIPRGEDCH